jgi:hypothetical protein
LKRLKDTPSRSAKLPTKLPFLKRNWTKTLQTLETNIEALQEQFDTAVRVHADACLVALGGEPDALKAQEKARTRLAKIETELADTKAALLAAGRRQEIEDQKAKAKAEAEHQKQVAKIQKDVYGTCGELDVLLDQVAEKSILLRDQTSALRLKGVRDAQMPVVNLDRALGSRLRRTGIMFGTHHPFDDKPLKLVGLCPDLSTTIAASTKESQ